MATKEPTISLASTHRNSNPVKNADSSNANDLLWEILKQDTNTPLEPPSAFAAIPFSHQQEHYQKINVEDMFKMASSNLPKPPEDWRNKLESTVIPGASKWNDVPSSPVDAWSNIVCPRPKNPCASNAQSKKKNNPRHSDPRFIPKHRATNNRPQGPQNLSKNGQYQTGQGAFIPLQATRNLTKGLPQTQMQQQENSRREERKVTLIVCICISPCTHKRRFCVHCFRRYG